MRKASPASSPPRNASRQRPGVVGALLTDTRSAILLLSACLSLLVLMTLAIWDEHGYIEAWRMQREVEQLAGDVEKIQQENRGLGREIERLQSDMSYIEKIAREELSLVRPGELVFEFAK